MNAEVPLEEYISNLKEIDRLNLQKLTRSISSADLSVLLVGGSVRAARYRHDFNDIDLMVIGNDDNIYDIDTNLSKILNRLDCFNYSGGLSVDNSAIWLSKQLSKYCNLYIDIKSYFVKPINNGKTFDIFFGSCTNIDKYLEMRDSKSKLYSILYK